MARSVNVNLDFTVRVEVPDDDPYFTTGREGTDEDNENYLEAETKVVRTAEQLLAQHLNGAWSEAIVFSDVSTEDVTELLNG